VATVFTSVSISLDGYIAGANDGPGNELGDGGMHLHDWVVGLRSWREAHGMAGGADGPDRAYVERVRGRYGACVMGRSMFDLGERPWGDEPPFHTPVFVVTHRERAPLEKAGGTAFHFETGGVARATGTSRSAAAARSSRSALRRACSTSSRCTLRRSSSAAGRACSTGPTSPGCGWSSSRRPAPRPCRT
jgi:dihydrofolate reductase